MSLAARRLRRDKIEDAVARRLGHRANVSIGTGQPSRVLPVSARPGSSGGGHDPAVSHLADCPGEPEIIWLPAGNGETAATGNECEPQSCHPTRGTTIHAHVPLNFGSESMLAAG